MLLRAEMKFHSANGDQTWSRRFLCCAGRGICFRFSISPLMYLFCVTNLTLYASICWFCTVTTAHPLVFTLSSILLLFLLVVLFCSSISMSLYLVKIICWLARLCVWLIDFACLIIVFLLSVFAHAVPKCLKYKKEKLSLDVSSDFKFITIRLMCRPCLWTRFNVLLSSHTLSPLH